MREEGEIREIRLFKLTLSKIIKRNKPQKLIENHNCCLSITYMVITREVFKNRSVILKDQIEGIDVEAVLHIIIEHIQKLIIWTC